jgi:biotin carboxyl carrier protein
VRKLGLTFDIITPFAGIIRKISAHKGDYLEEGDVAFWIDANGISHKILSPISGYIDVIEVDEGDYVLSGMILGNVRVFGEKLS